MTTLLSTSPEDFIPFFAIFFTFMVPILGMYFYYQNKNKIMDERKLMIEKGLTPPPLKEQSFNNENYQSKNAFTKGLNLIAIALGLLVGYFISHYTYIHFPFTVIGSILFFLGVANIVTAIMNSKDNRNNSSINETFNEKL
jgi:F0F1-type ATP synthase assembly protein I